ncbi:MAG: hypothetical protein K8F36_05640 [Melioribacteraceae bacterium]|nr:hypothetical protein [Melioribacteraceae bacterium]
MKLIKLISYNLFIVVFLILVVELSIYLLYPEIQLNGTDHQLLKDSVYYDSPGLNPKTSGKSNSVEKETNNNGFWKFSSSSEKEKSVLYLGDSVTMGIGVENDSTFPGRINNYSSSDQILNISLIGYSIYDYDNIVRKLFVEDNLLEIDEVNMFWCLNDIYSVPLGDESPEMKNSFLLSDMLQFLRTNSRIYQLLKATFTDRPKTYFLYDVQYYKEDKTELIDAVKKILSIRRTLLERGIGFKLYLLPYEYQLRMGIIDKKSPTSIFYKKIKSADDSLLVTDLTPILYKQMSNSTNDYFLYGDGIHFSINGHKIIYEVLTRLNN